MKKKKSDKPKIFVLDTNVLIHNPQAMFSFSEHRVVIPLIVIEEVDNFKKGVDEKGRNARQIGRLLDGLRKQGSLKDGVVTERGGIVQVAFQHEATIFDDGLVLTKNNDNLIIGTAYKFMKNYPDHDVFLISKDANVRIKADAIGLFTDNYDSDKINFEELYTGFSDIKLGKEIFSNLREKKFLTNSFGNFYPNQFVKFYCESEGYILTRFSVENNTFYTLKFYQGQEVFGITARNIEQELALDLLLDDSVKMVTLIGIAGTGKTLLAMAAGLNQVVEEDKYKRLVISRPIFPLGKDLGYLPGSKEDKFNPWMQPIYDNMEILIHNHADNSGNQNGRVFGKKTPSINDYLDFGFIELEPLTYIRGRSLPNQYMIIDEAQNLTPHEMKTIITRAGEKTNIVLTGDPYQIDIPYLDSESNGLSMSVDKLKTEKLVGHITLEKGERSALADVAAKYF